MEYVKKANLPNKKVSKVIVDYRISSESEKTLNKIGIDCIKTVKCKYVYDEINGHPDIQLLHLGDNRIIVANNLFDYYKKKFLDFEIFPIKGKSILKEKYPFDIAYNGCIIGNIFVHNLKYTDKILFENFKQMGFNLVNVNQGYSKCSISILNENNIITSDIGIEKALSKYINVLYIENENNITLGNMKGFIGGASGLISNDIWCINGDINRLKNCNKILDFLKLNKIDLLCLNNSEVVDIGSILPIIY